MNPLTQASPHAPVDGLTSPTSVTCSEDQSTAGALGEPEADRHRGEQPGDLGDLAASCRPREPRLGDCGVIGETPTSSTSISADAVQSDHFVTSSASRRPSTTTMSAPTKLPMEKQACSRLITGRRRACSTATPSVFMETSIAPLPRPKTAAPSTSTG